MSTHEWMTGDNGTEYYINIAHGRVVGSVSDAKLGLQLYKVNIGKDSDLLYHKKTNARTAVEKSASAFTAADLKLSSSKSKTPARTVKSATKKKR